VKWTGVLAPLDTESADGRVIATPDKTRELLGSDLYTNGALVFQGMRKVGEIHQVWVANGNLMGRGTLFVQSLIRELRIRGFLTGGLDMVGKWTNEEAPTKRVLMDWYVTGFHIHDTPAFPQTRLVEDPEPVETLPTFTTWAVFTRREDGVWHYQGLFHGAESSVARVRLWTVMQEKGGEYFEVALP